MKCSLKSSGRRPVVVFDIDDTLYLETDYARSGFRAVGERVERERGLAGFGARCVELFDAGVRGSIFDAALQNYPDPDVAVADLVAEYRAHRPDIAMLPDAAALIELLRGRAWFAAISDGPHISQIRKVEALDLRQHGVTTILTDRWGKEFWKPSPRAYAVIERMFRNVATSFCYIADNPAKDFRAPRARGWTCIRVRRAGGLHAHAESVSGEVDLELDWLDPARILPAVGLG
jgi:putative hydrolase of the HAD superfamily